LVVRRRSTGMREGDAGEQIVFEQLTGLVPVSSLRKSRRVSPYVFRELPNPPKRSMTPLFA
jgi:hypothetical protein